MKLRFLITLGCLATGFVGQSQDPLSTKINAVYDNQPEQILLNTDRSVYVTGDTIWYSAMILYGHSPAIHSSVLYTELWGSDGKMLSEQVLPIRQAHSEGMHSIPKDAVGPLLLRVYTSNAKNDISFIPYSRSIALFSSTEKKITASVNAEVAKSASDWVSLQATTSKDFVFFTLLRDDNKSPSEVFTLVALLNRQLIYKAPADLRQESVLGGRIPIPASGTGRLEILVLDKTHSLVGYHLIHMGNDDPLKLLEITTGIAERNKTSFVELNWKDSLPVQLSIAVTAADLPPITDSSEWIVNKEFWKNVLSNGISEIDTSSTNYIRWSAQLNAGLTKRFKNKQLVLVINAPAQELQYHTVQVSETGKIDLNGLQYHDSSRVYYMEPGKKGITPLTKNDISITDNLLNIKDKPSSPRLPFPAIHFSTEKTDNANQVLKEYADYKAAQSVVELKGVTVAAKKQQERELIDKKYATGPFTREDGVRIILPEDDPAFFSSLNVLHYLDGRVAGMQVDRVALENAIYWRSGVTSIFIDEISQQVPNPSGNGFVEDARRLAATPMSDVAMIKIFSPPFLGSWGNGPGGAIAVYLKKGEDRVKKLPPAPPLARGFSRPGLFHSFADKTAATIYWNPQVILQGKQHVFRIALPEYHKGKKLRAEVLAMDALGKITRKEIVFTCP